MIKASSEHAIWTSNVIREALGQPPLIYDDQKAESEVPANPDKVQAAVQNMYSPKDKTRGKGDAEEEVEMRTCKQIYREDLESRPDYNQWSPTSRTIILSVWEVAKTNLTEREKLYAPHEWAKHRKQEEVRQKFRMDKVTGNLPANAVEPTRYHPKAHQLFHQAEGEKGGC